MVEPEQLAAEFGRPPLRELVIRRPDHEAASRPLFRGVGERHNRGDAAVAPDERAAAFVRIRLLAVNADRGVDAGQDEQLLTTH